ncbi:MAG: DUF6776 family protein [Pseudomonadota bacterium]
MAKPMRRRSDERLRWYLAIGGVAMLAGGYLIFEMGRVSADYNTFEVAAERRTHRASIGELEATIAELRETIVQNETIQATDREAYRAVEQNLGQLQSKIQEQREAIAFYRGIISPAASNAGLQIQNLQLLRGTDEATYRLRMTLVQVKQHHREVYGKVNLSVDGAQDGEAVSYPLSQLLDDDEKKRWNYGFRYFQDFERRLALPDGFSPLTVNIELVPKGAGNVGLKQSFPWSTSPDQSAG